MPPKSPERLEVEAILKSHIFPFVERAEEPCTAYDIIAAIDGLNGDHRTAIIAVLTTFSGRGKPLLKTTKRVNVTPDFQSNAAAFQCK